jgi:hypothetical protein
VGDFDERRVRIGPEEVDDPHPPGGDGYGVAINVLERRTGGCPVEAARTR